MLEKDMPNNFLNIILSIQLVIGSSLSTVERRKVCGRPCLIVPATSKELYPTLFLLGGIAQSASSWEHQLPSLSRNRRVVVYECLGQGRGINDDGVKSDNIVDFTNVSLPFQAEMFLEALEEVCGFNDPVDIAGFSFGGRVAMAVASMRHDRIRKLHLTGVGSDRSDYGHLAIESFKDVIKGDPSLRSFAWAVLLATYSPAYLRQISMDMRERFLYHIMSNNTPNGLLALLEQAEVTEENDPFHVVQMGGRLGTKVVSKLCVGEHDRMAPVDQVLQLAGKLRNQDVDVIPNCGHAVAVEASRAWKDSVISFFNET
jgi:pimeloyl-ACP methyl ester carboxylesterase